MTKTARAYITGFILSLVLTGASFSAVTEHLLSASGLIFAILVFAFIQLFVQLFFFLHIGQESKPRLNLITLMSTAALLFIIVAGSIWIMNHLNENMMMSPRSMDNYVLQQSDGGGY